MGVEDLQSAPDQDHEADHGDPMGQPGEESVAIYHHGMRRLNWHRVRAHTRKVVDRIHHGGAHLTSDAGEWARDSTPRVPDYFAGARLKRVLREGIVPRRDLRAPAHAVCRDDRESVLACNGEVPMRRSFALVSWIVTLLILTAGAGAAPLAALQQLLDALARGDSAAAFSLFTDDAVFHTPSCLYTKTPC